MKCPKCKNEMRWNWEIKGYKCDACGQIKRPKVYDLEDVCAR